MVTLIGDSYIAITGNLNLKQVTPMTHEYTKHFLLPAEDALTVQIVT